MNESRPLEHAIDMHVHAWPDIRPRLLDAFQVAEFARGEGMQAVVIKNHYMPTADIAALVGRKVPGIDLFGGLVLNHSIGGFNPFAVETALQMGARVIWMPTVSSRLEAAARGNAEGLSVYGDKIGSRLKKEVTDILELLAASSAVLASGHLSPDETETLFEISRQAGVRKFLVTHPEETSINMSLERQKALADKGAYIEYCFNYCTPRKNQRNINDYATYIRYLGPERCVLSTDLGQVDNFLPTEGFRVFIQALRGAGIPADWIDRMCVRNPRDLLYG